MERNLNKIMDKLINEIEERIIDLEKLLSVVRREPTTPKNTFEALTSLGKVKQIEGQIMEAKHQRSNLLEARRRLEDNAPTIEIGSVPF